MSRTVEFFFDFVSPYSYLAYSQLDSLQADISLRPMHVLSVMKAVGNTPTTVTCAAKGRYAGADLARWARRYGVEVKRPDMRAMNNAACARAVLAAPSSEIARQITTALFNACWRDGQTLTTTAEVLCVLEAAGIETASLAGQIDAPETLERLEKNNQEAADRGVFGAPSFLLGDSLFFGNDRLDFVREHLAGA
ncbi:2-hydroxychromene-2-carboxylate isomerase [Pseudomonas panipatensis]|uniref:2-hydroxychromene-2-carboxylate isomerase n=1 Tax=Pseudomonas panipatensis TaxID=428992 RepID=A0A1G8DQV9_9PSED|nr:2-hydroxychromene-2-carboxylate isomerase [Pseudomonas panipatensis]SDH60018.1 2-hydroxychromene-2-carboxylate isomerase [Pseudomonas panipatensis]SMP40117.1 2-hydroxychromene-2-carboxylate isomerase [Pseudomonas panipatensis]